MHAQSAETSLRTSSAASLPPPPPPLLLFSFPLLVLSHPGFSHSPSLESATRAENEKTNETNPEYNYYYYFQRFLLHVSSSFSPSCWRRHDFRKATLNVGQRVLQGIREFSVIHNKFDSARLIFTIEILRSFDDIHPPHRWTYTHRFTYT